MIFGKGLVVLGCLGLVSAKTKFLGVAIAGGDFGCEIDGNCPTSKTQLPLSSLGGGDGEGQMKHFVADSNVNLFRLSVSWQFLVNKNPSGPLDPTNFQKYDQLMQTCLATGTHCMIDIHNFARFNDQIIGQGGPSNADFASLWRQLAEAYAGEERVMFGLMNEPHHLDIQAWADTCQEAVNAIRGAGAASQLILLPGTNFDSAATLIESGSGDALMDVRNPDGGVEGLVLDVHKYLDVDNSGTHEECVTDNVDAFKELAEYLRGIGRLGLVSETGASRSSSCLEKFCAQNQFINENSDVFLGIVGWAAGSFSTGYLMSLTPEKQNGGYVDNQLMRECVIAPWVNSKDTLPPVTPKESTSGASRPMATATGSGSPSGSGSGTSGTALPSDGASVPGTSASSGGSTVESGPPGGVGAGAILGSPLLMASLLSGVVITLPLWRI